MKDYAIMSDFEINSAVSMALLDKSAHPSARYFAVGDYCNNPADAWPVIVESRISIKAVLYSQWMAEDYLEEISSLSQNPLRCAMIVFLMMKENEND